MLARLSGATRSHHSVADEDRLKVMDVTTIAQYRRMLCRIHGFEAAVEHALMRISGIDPAFQRDYCKVGDLCADLATLGLSARALASLPMIASPTVRTADEAFGWLFVLERQWLVSGLACRHLQYVLGGQVAGAISYFSAHAMRPGARFRAFGEALGRTMKQWSAVVSGATEAFHTQRHWYASLDIRLTSAAPTRGPCAPGADDLESWSHV